jgi:hypothetical protein
MMKHLFFTKNGLILCVALMLLPLAGWAEEKLPGPEGYSFYTTEYKKQFDDPTDLFVTRPLKSILPPEIDEIMTFDKEKMKKETAELLGFSAPELVGKIAPEIKPGKYTFKDLAKYPGLKELFPPLIVKDVLKPGAPPLVGNIPEFEIIPTRQFYMFLPLIEASRRNLGKTKLDKDGYIDPWSWEGGVPFPRPSGEFKAQQVLYDFDRRSTAYDSCWGIWGNNSHSFNKNLKMDKRASVDVAGIRYKGRVLFPPYGWYDERAKRNNEWMGYGYNMLEPRANRGLIMLRYRYDDPDRLDPAMIYVPSLRRVRKMSGTDTQDPSGDMIYDDQNMFMQKITPNKYPYKYEIIEEREYLMFYSYGSSPAWIDSKNGYAVRGLQAMRRPCYVFQMTQLDPNYTYSKRIYYIDMETFGCIYNENYDQKGRLYRAQYYHGYSFFPEYGVFNHYGGVTVQRDYVDTHSAISSIVGLPVAWPRARFSMGYLTKRGK